MHFGANKPEPGRTRNYNKSDTLQGQNLSGNSLLITNQRHKRALQAAREQLIAAILSSEAMPADFVSIDLRIAMEAIGEITGESVHDSLLKEIFENFCIGK